MKFFPLGTSLAAAVLLTACGGGGGGSDPISSTEVRGSGVKGPLADAGVTLYRLDPSDPLGHGAVLDTGRTDAQAAITGLSLGGDVQGPLLVEVVADAKTLDLTTGKAPVITRLVTVQDAATLRGSGAVYPTPLSTMAVDLALRNADHSGGGYQGDGNGVTSVAEVMAALPFAARQVKSAFGFGLLDNSDILADPPLLTADTGTDAARQAVLNLRTAVEAVAALAASLQETAKAANSGSAETPQSMFDAMVADLSDGVIDGNAGSEPLAAFADIADPKTAIARDPASLAIAGTSRPLSEIKQVLSEEVAATGTGADTNLDAVDATPRAANPNPDSDGDGVADSEDAFPADPSEVADFDGDGIGDNADPDDDNDGLSDSQEIAIGSDPKNADTDGDGAVDGQDAFPLDASETLDTDGDGIGNNADTDDDGDGTPDTADAFPLNPNESVDVDGDGTGANADPDDNNPCVPDQTTVACQGTSQPAVWDQFKWDQASWQ